MRGRAGDSSGMTGKPSGASRLPMAAEPNGRAAMRTRAGPGPSGRLQARQRRSDMETSLVGAARARSSLLEQIRHGSQPQLELLGLAARPLELAEIGLSKRVDGDLEHGNALIRIGGAQELRHLLGVV